MSHFVYSYNSYLFIYVIIVMVQLLYLREKISDEEEWIVRNDAE